MIYDVLIVGAGISGITAANKLIENGFTIKIVDKGKMLGGRLATKRILLNGEKVTFDYGCKYLEASSFEFSNKLIDLIKNDHIKKWNVTNQNAVLNELDNAIKLIGKKSIRDIAIQLADKMDVESNTIVERISNKNDSWTIETSNGTEFETKDLILSMPIPQALELIDKSQIKLDNSKIKKLSEISYNRSIVALFTTKSKSKLLNEGGLKIEDEDIAFITDNSLKGINQNHTAIVVEMTNKFSISNWNKTESELVNKIKELAEEWIGTDILDGQIHKWKFSTPASIYNKRFEVFDDPIPLHIIGDAFMGNNVESAYLSGLFSAKNILEKKVSLIENPIL